MTIRISKEKLANLEACANTAGIISALAVDQRGSLQKSLSAAGAVIEAGTLESFKSHISETLSPYATAILLDPEYGLSAASHRASSCGLLLAYEQSGYDNSRPGRLPDLLPGWSARRIREAGAQAIKALVYYNPADSDSINEEKKAFVERIGAECQAEHLAFFLEPLTYDDSVTSAIDYARLKPELVRACLKEFSQERYRVDILKVELPFDPNFVEGFASQQHAYSQDEVMALSTDVMKASSKAFIFLSAGVAMDVFAGSLELMGQAKVPFSGVLCGRATWKAGIDVFAKNGETSLKNWLKGAGTNNIKQLTTVVDQHAVPWWHLYGSKGAITIN